MLIYRVKLINRKFCFNFHHTYATRKIYEKYGLKPRPIFAACQISFPVFRGLQCIVVMTYNLIGGVGCTGARHGDQRYIVVTNKMEMMKEQKQM